MATANIPTLREQLASRTKVALQHQQIEADVLRAKAENERQSARKQNAAILYAKNACLRAAWNGKHQIHLSTSLTEWEKEIATELGIGIHNDSLLTPKEKLLVKSKKGDLSLLWEILIEHTTPTVIAATMRTVKPMSLRGWSQEEIPKKKLTDLVNEAFKELSARTASASSNLADAELEIKKFHELCIDVENFDVETQKYIDKFLKKKAIFADAYQREILVHGGHGQVNLIRRIEISEMLLSAIGIYATDVREFFDSVDLWEESQDFGKLKKLEEKRVTLVDAVDKRLIAQTKLKLTFDSVCDLFDSLVSNAQIAECKIESIPNLSQKKTRCMFWSGELRTNAKSTRRVLTWLSGTSGRQFVRKLLSHLQQSADMGMRRCIFHVIDGDEITKLEDLERTFRGKVPCDFATFKSLVEVLDLNIAFRELKSGGYKLTIRWK